MEFIDSSSVEALGYDAAAQELHVLFKTGKTYVYFEVEEFRYQELRMADSKGSYFNREVKTRYRYEEQ